MATCIGSGFATGSEFLSFFVAHGIGGAIGAIAISLIIYFLFTKELFNKGQDLPAEYHNNILAYYFGKIGGEIFDWFSAILVGGCYLIMLNGAGTTLNQYLDWDPLVGAALMALAAIITVWFGLRKLTDIIGSIGPVIAAFSVIIGVVALFRADFSNVDATLQTMNLSKAAPNWWLCGIAYPCFAMMTLTPALPSMGATANNRKTTTAAAVFGVLMFHLAIAVIVFAIFGNLDSRRGPGPQPGALRPARTRGSGHLRRHDNPRHLHHRLPYDVGLLPQDHYRREVAQIPCLHNSAHRARHDRHALLPSG